MTNDNGVEIQHSEDCVQIPVKEYERIMRLSSIFTLCANEGARAMLEKLTLENERLKSQCFKCNGCQYKRIVENMK